MTQDVPTLWDDYGIIADVVVRHGHCFYLIFAEVLISSPLLMIFHVLTYINSSRQIFYTKLLKERSKITLLPG